MRHVRTGEADPVSACTGIPRSRFVCLSTISLNEVDVGGQNLVMRGAGVLRVSNCTRHKMGS